LVGPLQLAADCMRGPIPAPVGKPSALLIVLFARGITPRHALACNKVEHLREQPANWGVSWLKMSAKSAFENEECLKILMLHT
jgi:hypothetical protein